MQRRIGFYDFSTACGGEQLRTSSPLEKMPVLLAFPEELDIDISKV